MSSGGTVEVRITGTIDPSLAASTAAATDEINAMNVAAEAWGAKLTAGAVAAQKVAPAIQEVGDAAEVASGHMGKNRAVTEAMVIAHEALSGRLSRIPGSLMIEVQALTGASSAMLIAGAATLALVGGIGYLIYESLEAKKNLDNLASGFELTGRGATFSKEEVALNLDLMRQMPGVTKDAANAFEHFIATHADISATLAAETEQLLPAFIRLYGKEGPEAVGKLSESLTNLNMEGFEKLDRELLNLQPQQFQNIQNLIETGQQAKAVSEILKDLFQNTGTYEKSLGDKVYDELQNIKSIKAELATVGIGPSSGQTQLALLNQLEAAEQRLAQIRKDEATQGQQEAAAGYKAQLEAAAKINDKLTEQQTLQKELIQQQANAAAAQLSGQDASPFLAAAQKLSEELNKIDATANAKTLAERRRLAAEELEIAVLEMNDEARTSKEKGEKLIAELKHEGEQEDAIRRQDLASTIAISKIGLEAKKQDLDREVAAHEITAQQKLKIEEKLVEEMADLDILAVNADLLANETDVVAADKAENQIAEIKAREHAELAALGRQETDDNNKELNKRTADYKSMVNTITSAERQLVQGIFSGRGNLTQSLAQFAQREVEDEIASDLEYYTAKVLYNQLGLNSDEMTAKGGLLVHLLTEGQKTGATAAGEAARLATKEAAHAAGAAADVASGSASILNDAYKAAAGAYSAVVGIPIVGPILAPIAAGVAFTAVSAFDVLTSAQGGSYNVGGGGLYNLHEEESVMPRNIADPMRDFFESGGGGGGGGGDTYNLHAHVHAETLDSASFAGKLEDHADTLVGMLAGKMRNGSRAMKAMAS